MVFNSGMAAFVIGLVVTLVTLFSHYFFGGSSISFYVIAVITFAVTYFLVYFTLEFLIFKEIKKIYELMDKLKKKDFKAHIKRIKHSFNPLEKINQEIFTFASKKEQEINELKKLEQYRREFLADVSHELKTPIFAAQGFIHTLIDGAIDDKTVRDRFLKKAAKSLDGLNLLVQDLLTLSQIEIGEIKMQFHDFDLLELVEEIFEQLESKAEKKGIKFKIHTDTSKKHLVHADPNRIRQVLTNLIDNAIKYGNEKGAVDVFLEKDKDHVHIIVRDNGPGIPPEHLGRIFERFYRVDKSRSKESGGTGLGLAIVKHILDAHGSKISVTSKTGKGSTFSFKLKKNTEKNSE
ncbi:MAG: ATP-binding protein [Cytophagales bacterium]